MDVRYRISGPGGVPFPNLNLTGKRRSESDSEILATKTRGSCGVDPGPARLRITLSLLAMGNWLSGVMKRIVLVRSLMFSTFAMVRFTA